MEFLWEQPVLTLENSELTRNNCYFLNQGIIIESDTQHHYLSFDSNSSVKDLPVHILSYLEHPIL